MGNMMSSCVLVIVVGALWGKVITGKVGEFLFCVSIFLQREYDSVMIFVSFSILAYVGLFLPSCVGKSGRVDLDRSKKLTHIP